MSKLKVLVVEDHPDLQDTYQMCLGHLVDVVIAGSVSSAMRALRGEEKFSLVILDGNVPRFDGEPLRPGDTTIALAQHISDLLGIPMLSASGDDSLNDILVSKGCMRATKLNAVSEARKFLSGLCSEIN